MRRYEVLERLIKENGWTRGAEIGVFRGDTFFYLLDNCPDLHLIGVDSWLPLPATQVKDIDKGLSSYPPRTPVRMAQYSQAVMERAEAHPRATIYRMDSVAAADKVQDGFLDFVFIDAEHTTEAVLADVRAWQPKARNILGHDEQWPSVRRALSQLFDSWTVHPDNVWQA